MCVVRFDCCVYLVYAVVVSRALLLFGVRYVRLLLYDVGCLCVLLGVGCVVARCSLRVARCVLLVVCCLVVVRC